MLRPMRQSNQPGDAISRQGLPCLGAPRETSELDLLLVRLPSDCGFRAGATDAFIGGFGTAAMSGTEAG